MKKLMIIPSLFISFSMYAQIIQQPFGAVIEGAGAPSSLIDTLIKRYNKIFPCPKFVYKQKPASRFSGSANGVARVLDSTVTFAISDEPVSDAILDETPDCLLQIPFFTEPLVIIYRLPALFVGQVNLSTWPGHLNIPPSALCTIYTNTTSATRPWNGLLLGQPFNGNQVSNENAGIPAFARSDSAFETSVFVRYLRCSNLPPTGTCASFLNAPNVISNPRGPFCKTGAPGEWSNPAAPSAFNPAVTCLPSSEDIARAIINNGQFGGIGYVPLSVAIAFGFFPGSPNGVPLGVAGLYDGTGDQNSPTNYVLPSEGIFQCSPDPICSLGYPLFASQFFIVYASQPTNFIACNIAQFIRFVLNEAPKLVGFSNPCLEESFAQLDQIASSICDPCVEPCNPCLNQTCPVPCTTECKA